MKQLKFYLLSLFLLVAFIFPSFSTLEAAIPTSELIAKGGHGHGGRHHGGHHKHHGHHHRHHGHHYSSHSGWGGNGLYYPYGSYYYYYPNYYHPNVISGYYYSTDPNYYYYWYR